jgi:putative transposase
MRTQRYPSDLTEAQWKLIKLLFPASVGGRPRKTDLRDVVNAIFYIVRTGCQWRYLPKDFPPKSTVWRYFDQWRRDGTLTDIHERLRQQVRQKEKPRRQPRTASIDSQSVDTSEGGEATGRDNAKNVNGRKRHIIVDSLGMLLAVVVTAADVDDAAAAPAVLQQLEGMWLPRLRRVYADNKYHNHALYVWMADNTPYELAVVRRPKNAKGWVLLPIRWTVERTFAWLNRCRRLSVDREKSTLSAEAMIRLAMIHLMLDRLCPKAEKVEFNYRKAA